MGDYFKRFHEKGAKNQRRCYYYHMDWGQIDAFMKRVERERLTQMQITHEYELVIT